MMREILAALAHEMWAGWMNYLFSKCRKRDNGEVVIPRWAVERWLRQATTLYKDLPEEEKKSDREEADRILTTIEETNIGQFVGFMSIYYGSL